MATTIWVLLVDDYEAWRRFVSTTLRKLPQMRIIGEALDGPSAVLSAQQLRPDLIVLDIGLPGLNGIEAARRIRELRLHSKILFLTENNSQEVAEEALRAGGNGYVVKSDAAHELLLAVDAVLQDKQFVSSSLAKSYLTDPNNERAPGDDQRIVILPSENVETVCRHNVGFYLDDRIFLDDLTRFIGTALHAGDAALVVATEAHREGLLPRLQAHGVDVVRAIQRRQYIALDAATIMSSLTVNNQLDPERFLKVAGDLIMTAAGTLKKKNPRVAICGECDPPLWTLGNGDAAIEFEKLWNEIVKRYDVDILCGYSLGTVQHVMDSQLFERISALHR